jgi:hypothetical protein
MSKHSKDQSPSTLVDVIACERHMMVEHKRKQIIWIGVVSVSSVMYVLGLNDILPFGFAFQHVEELVLTTGVIRVIGA